MAGQPVEKNPRLARRALNSLLYSTSKVQYTCIWQRMCCVHCVHIAPHQHLHRPSPPSSPLSALSSPLSTPCPCSLFLAPLLPATLQIPCNVPNVPDVPKCLFYPPLTSAASFSCFGDVMARYGMLWDAKARSELAMGFRSLTPFRHILVASIAQPLLASHWVVLIVALPLLL